MPRRRNRKDDSEDGIVGLVLILSKANPTVGIFFGLIFGISGAYLTWANTKLIYGIAPLFGVSFLFLSVFCLALGIAGQFKSRN